MHCPSVADRRQRGSVTAEFALALPAVVLLLVFCLALLSGGTAQLRASDAAPARAVSLATACSETRMAFCIRPAMSGKTFELTRCST